MGPPWPGPSGPAGIATARPLLELQQPVPIVPATPPPQRLPERPRYGLALLLLALTFFTATSAGPAFLLWSRTDVMTDLDIFLLPSQVARVWSDPALLRLGLSYSIPALLILLAHELGHYIACRLYRLPVTLPYFLPSPGMLGTLGAFIKIKAPLRSKKELFDVGIAGPIAGFVALVPFLLYGAARSQPVALDAFQGGLLVPARCLAIDLALWLFHGPLEPGMVVNYHPFALAAWFGLLATAINLIPLGQLDGGHILYAAAGRWQRRLALPLWLALGLAGILWPGWLLWCALTFLMGLYHPPVWDESTPLDRKRRWLAASALVMLVLSFPLGSALEIREGSPPPGSPTGLTAALP